MWVVNVLFVNVLYVPNVLLDSFKVAPPSVAQGSKNIFLARISVIWDRVIKMWRSMSKQNFIADSIFAFLSPCLLFISSKSAVDCRTFQSSHYSNQNRTVIGGDSVQNGWFRVVLPIVTHLQCVLPHYNHENVRKSPNLIPDFAILWKLGNFVGCTGRWNFKCPKWGKSLKFSFY